VKKTKEREKNERRKGRSLSRQEREAYQAVKHMDYNLRGRNGEKKERT